MHTLTASELVNSTSNQADLFAAAKHAMAATWRSIHNTLERSPISALESVLVGTRQKKALKIDVVGEIIFEDRIKGYDGSRFENLDFYGEETLRDEGLDLKDRDNLCVLADIIDGTDLLERGLSNWCSAVVFFLPTAPVGQKILGSFVVVPPGDLYFSTLGDEHVHRLNIKQPKISTKVSGVSEVTLLEKASICFYGQKAKNFSALAGYRLFQNFLQNGISNSFRMYTLAGIPMILKLIDHRVKTASNIDAVFDVMGQQPHDVVPGAYLALKAGATVRNLLTGVNMTFEDLENSLMKPAAAASKLKYVIASTPELAASLSELLQPAIGCSDQRVCALSKSPML